MTQTERDTAFFVRLGRLETEETPLSDARLQRLTQLALQQIGAAAETDIPAAAEEQTPARTASLRRYRLRRWATAAAACLAVLAGAALLPQLTVKKDAGALLFGARKNAGEAPMAAEQAEDTEGLYTETAVAEEAPAEQAAPKDAPVIKTRPHTGPAMGGTAAPPSAHPDEKGAWETDGSMPEDGEPTLHAIRCTRTVDLPY